MELGRTREWLQTADSQDVERARWHLFAGRLAGAATEPFRARRQAEEIEMIENAERRTREARAYNKRRLADLKAAELEQVETRKTLLLDEPDEDLEEREAPDG